MDFSQKLYRYRYALMIIKLAVVLHIFVSSKDVQAILRYAFRVAVSHKTVCEWTKKFREELPLLPVTYENDETILLFADEKYVWIKKAQAYWWSVRDHLGNVLANLVTLRRDAASAQQLFRRAKVRLQQKVNAVIHDGLESYTKPVKSTFGRKCENIVAGIQGRFKLINHELYWVTNNISESLNAQIDVYLGKVHYNFNSLEEANHFAYTFLYRKHLRDACS